jgi:hypothetical protein
MLRWFRKKVKQIGDMTYIFWICWVGEMIGSIWWINSEMKLKMLAPNPLSFLGAVYLLMVLSIRYGFDATGVSTYLVLIPAVPLVPSVLLVLLHYLKR